MGDQAVVKKSQGAPVVLDHRGRRVVRAASYGYPGASNARVLAGLNAVDLGANTLIAFEHEELRARARQLDRGTGRVEACKRAWRTNVIGKGIRPRFTSTELGDHKARLAGEFGEWSERTGFYDKQAEVKNAELVDGEILGRHLRLRPSESPGTVPYRLQLMEADFVPYQAHGVDELKRKVWAGVEFNRAGEPTAYRVLKEHPKEMLGFGVRLEDTVRVPAREMVHVFRSPRAGALRGVSWFAPVIKSLHQSELYNELELARLAFAAGVQGKISPAPGAEDVVVLGADGAEVDKYGFLQGIQVGPNTIVPIPFATDLELFKVDGPSEAYRDFFDVIDHMIAAALGVPYEAMTGDLEKVSFSSARVGLMEFRRSVEMDRGRLERQFLTPTYRRWLDEAFLSGRLIDPRYPANRSEYLKLQWYAPSFEWVDPHKHELARLLRLQMGLTTRAREAEEMGVSVEELDAEIEKDQWMKPDREMLREITTAVMTQIAEQGKVEGTVQ